MKLKYSITLVSLLSLTNMVCAMQNQSKAIVAASVASSERAVEVSGEEREVLRLFNETMRCFPELFEIHRQLAGLKALVATIDYKKIAAVTITIKYGMRSVYDAMFGGGVRTLLSLIAQHKASSDNAAADKVQNFVAHTFRPASFALDLTVDVKKIVELLQTLAGEDNLKLEDAAEETWQDIQRFLIPLDGGTLTVSDAALAAVVPKFTPEIIKDMIEATGQTKMVIEKINAGLGHFVNFRSVEIAGDLSAEIKVAIVNILGLIKVLKDRLAQPDIVQRVLASLEQQKRLFTCIAARRAG